MAWLHSLLRFHRLKSSYQTAYNAHLRLGSFSKHCGCCQNVFFVLVELRPHFLVGCQAGVAIKGLLLTSHLTTWHFIPSSFRPAGAHLSLTSVHPEKLYSLASHLIESGPPRQSPYFKLNWFGTLIISIKSLSSRIYITDWIARGLESWGTIFRILPITVCKCKLALNNEIWCMCLGCSE